LREHREDIPALAKDLLAENSLRTGLGQKQFTDAALERLARYDWPGNLDELKRVVQTLASNALSETIDTPDIDALLGSASLVDSGLMAELFAMPLKEARDAFEKAYLEAVLQECGSMSRAAERSGLERTHLYRKLKQLGVKVPSRNDSN